MRITYVGGPTALIEHAGARLLTDPTFDPPESYELPAYTLRKTIGPAVAPDALGRIDAVLLSHDHHMDNLDRAGRTMLDRAAAVLTTTAGAERLGRHAVGMAPWQSERISLEGGGALTVTATPARHGPPQGDRGPVIGFVLDRSIYVSGDTVWYEGVRDVAERFDIVAAILFMGAAKVRAAGDWPLTFTAAGAVEAARAMPRAAIVPLHFEGWEHFSETRGDIAAAFEAANLAQRLVWPPAGRAIDIP